MVAVAAGASVCRFAWAGTELVAASAFRFCTGTDARGAGANAGAGADAECSGVLHSLFRRAGDNAIVMLTG